jgi:eukaryotic-like serine/threonine-protein kinase
LDIDPGTVVANRYRISRPLGRGGMGEVFAAENIRTGRPVAVKLLRSDSKAKSSAVARFRREARAAGSINSDHVTQVLDVEEDAEHGIVLVFELLEGESLIDRLKRTGPIPFDELHPIIDQVWMGLADAHRAGIIHRDLKPSNVFLERRPDGSIRVKILDFGISKLPKEMGGETLTEMGQSLGTFSFMPPEQIGKAKTVDHRADIYACATMIYQALSGQLPYTARNILVMVEMKTKTEARKLADAMGCAVDPRIEGFLARGLARDAGARFQTALEALNAWRDLRPNSPSQPAAPGSGSHSSQATPPPMSPSGGMPNSPRASGVSGQMPAVSAASGSPMHRTPLPIAVPEPINDMSTDSSAATLAMPISKIGNPEALMGARGLGAGGTILVKASDNPAAAKRSNDANQSMHRPTPERRPTPMPGSTPVSQHQQPYYVLPPNASPHGQVRQASQPQLPRLNEDSTSVPGSGDQTRVYRPDRSGAAAQEQASLKSGGPMVLPQPQAVNGPPEKKSSALALLLGAIAFALVGFGIVAFLLKYL